MTPLSCRLRLSGAPPRSRHGRFFRARGARQWRNSGGRRWPWDWGSVGCGTSSTQAGRPAVPDEWGVAWQQPGFVAMVVPGEWGMVWQQPGFVMVAPDEWEDPSR